MSDKQMENERLVTLDKFGCSFEFPEKITVRQSLEFWSLAGRALASDQYRHIYMWQAVVGADLIQNWSCELFPDFTVSLDDVDDVNIAELIMVINGIAFNYMNNLKAVSKK